MAQEGTRPHFRFRQLSHGFDIVALPRGGRASTVGVVLVGATLQSGLLVVGLRGIAQLVPGSARRPRQE
jgi:hypothetical protein